MVTPTEPRAVHDGALPSAVAVSEAADGTRLCGRCRKPSERNPADPPQVAAPWFLCPPCREALLGGIGRGRKE